MLADELALEASKSGRQIIRASADDFHLRRSQRCKRGRDAPEGYYYDGFNLSELADVLLRPLGPGGSRVYRTAVFDWRTDMPVTEAPLVAADGAVLIVDGVFLLRPELRSHWDFSIFVWAFPEERLARSLVRDLGASDSAEELERLFWSRYVPAHELYSHAVAPHTLADAFIDNERLLAPTAAYRR